VSPLTAPPEVKICGLTRREDALAAAEAGATHAGVVFAPGRRTVSEATARVVMADLPLRRVGVFVNLPVAELLGIAHRVPLEVIQLHGDESPDQIAQLRREWGGEVWKALRPRGVQDFLEELEIFSAYVDGILLDGWSPTERGGAGARFPWEQLAQVRHAVPASLSLAVAGGLTPENVATAIELLTPDLVDVSSGVEAAPGIKDHAAVRRFVAAARAVPSYNPVSGDDVSSQR
jgi:phosphoribosylanthranilate isomerase